MHRLTRNSLITDLPMPIKLQESCGEDACMEACEQYVDNNCNGCPVQECMSKLSEYEDLEEQGLLIKLPCKIGQDLYIVSNRVDGKGHVRRLTLTHNNLGNVLKRLDDDIFKTREEAEKALEESNGE